MRTVWAGLAVLGFSQWINAVTVDLYQNMENGGEGELLTTKAMDASSYGGYLANDSDVTWSLTGSMWVSTSYARQLPGIVTVNGKNYLGSGYRTWKFSDKYQRNFVTAQFGTERKYNNPPYHDRMTVACYYTPGQTNVFSNNHDNIEVGYPLLVNGIPVYGVFQTTGDPAGGPYFRIHTELGSQVSDKIKIVAGKTYWINLHYNGVAGRCYAANFDPDNNWTQVGATVSHEAVPNSKVSNKVNFGRIDSHGDNTSWPNETFTYISHIMIDYTNAAFPLLPDISSANTDRMRPNGHASSQVTIRVTRTSVFATLPGQAGDARLSIVNLAGKEVYCSTLSRDGAVYNGAWHTPPDAGAYIAIVNKTAPNGNAAVAFTKFVITR
jgi:hypothetical protein